jgi:hypothetical protein
MRAPLCWLGIVVLMLGATAAVFAQDTASITGTVTDSTGAAIPGAQVALNNPALGASRVAKSNGSGDYLFAALPVGSYNISVTASGFKKYEAQGIVLRVGEKARANVSMAVGAANVEVIVQGANIAQVQTQSSELSGNVSGKEISQLQLNGRNFTQLVTLVPGVSNQTGQDEGTVGVAGNVAYSINGGRTEYNNWELDGGDNMDNGSNTSLNVYPSLDAIGEFTVLTSNYGAQYGRNGSGTVEVETKSGTKAFHGDAYEFNRNDDYNARNYFQSSVPEYKKNDFGYTIGGPVYIPGVYNKNKEKTFFFWSQEWRRERVAGQVFNVNVPSTQERQGNFTDQCTQGGDCPVDPATGQPFPNNQVPFNPNDPNIQALLALIPAPNAGSGINSFYNASPIQPTNWREELVRVDHNITSNERITFRYIHDSWDTVNPTPLWTNAGSFPTIQTDFSGPSVGSVLRLTSTFSPTLLNEFVFSYTTDHISLTNVGAVNRPANTTFGDLFGGNGGGIIPGINLVSVSAYNGGFGEDPGYIPQGPYNSNPTYTYRDNMSKLVGKHNLQFGGYLVFAQKNELGGELGAGSTPGYISFDATQNPNTTGNPFADLLTQNIYSFGQQSQKIKYYNRYKIVEPYFQDDFHVTSRLTLNLGLRVSLFGTYREKYHQAFNFDPTAYVQGQTSYTIAQFTGTGFGNVTGLTPNGGTPSVSNLPNGIVQCGVTPGVPVSCMQGHLFNPAPRIGFAWDPFGDGKWALRGGYGIFYEHTNGNEGNTESLENSPPLATTLTQLYINGYSNIGKGVSGGQGQLPLNVVSIPTKAVWPYMQQWHLDLQHQIAGSTVVTMSYVGSVGTHLTQVSELNQLQPVPLALNPYNINQAFNSTADCAQFQVQNPPLSPTGVATATINGHTATGSWANNLSTACGNDANGLRPYVGYGDITKLADAASSNYNALQLGARRTAKGLTLSFSYTYSHSIDDSSSRQDGNLVNSYDPALNRASSNFDQRHNLSVSYVYDLPFLRNNNLSGKLLGGWQYSGIMSFSTGSPFTVTFPGDNAGVANGVTTTAAYADIVGDPNAGGHVTIPGQGIQIYNPNAYAAPRGLTFGDSGRNSLTNPNRTNFDMALFKTFAIKESMHFEFRAEAFNVFNHTELGYINGDGGSGASNSANLNSGTSGFGGTNFLQILSAHNARILQLGAKFIF